MSPTPTATRHDCPCGASIDVDDADPRRSLVYGTWLSDHAPCHADGPTAFAQMCRGQAELASGSDRPDAELSAAAWRRLALEFAARGIGVPLPPSELDPIDVELFFDQLQDRLPVPPRPSAA